MMVWLFQDLKIEDPVKDFERFVVLLRNSIGSLAVDLYFPMMFFEQEKDTYQVADVYREKFEELRTKLFEQRERVNVCKTPEELGNIANSIHVEVNTNYDQLLFVLATMPDEYHWIGSCNIHKNVTGVLKSTTNEMSALLHILRHLEKKCLRKDVV